MPRASPVIRCESCVQVMRLSVERVALAEGGRSPDLVVRAHRASPRACRAARRARRRDRPARRWRCAVTSRCRAARPASSSTAVSTFRPMPITAQPSCGRASIRMPATLRPVDPDVVRPLDPALDRAPSPRMPRRRRARPPAAAAPCARLRMPHEHGQREGPAGRRRPRAALPAAACGLPLGDHDRAVRRPGERQLARVVVGRADLVEVHERSAKGPCPAAASVVVARLEQQLGVGADAQRAGCAALVHRDRDAPGRVLVRRPPARSPTSRERAARRPPRRCAAATAPRRSAPGSKPGASHVGGAQVAAAGCRSGRRDAPACERGSPATPRAPAARALQRTGIERLPGVLERARRARGAPRRARTGRGRGRWPTPARAGAGSRAMSTAGLDAAAGCARGPQQAVVGADEQVSVARAQRDRPPRRCRRPGRRPRGALPWGRYGIAFCSDERCRCARRGAAGRA